MSDADPEYELAMPFLPVRSRSGPHDDDAYVAGYEMGLLDMELRLARRVVEGRPIRDENAEQADLIAMRHGYRASVTPQSDGWSWLEVSRA